jgi:hypothetical protein
MYTYRSWGGGVKQRAGFFAAACGGVMCPLDLIFAAG